MMKQLRLFALAALFCAVIFPVSILNAQETTGAAGDNGSGLTVSELIDEYIDLRFDGTADDTANLLEHLDSAGLNEFQELEEALRGRRAAYPETAGWIGTITKHDVDCLHVDYSTTCFLFVPEEINFEAPVSLVIVGHGGNSSMSQQRAEGTARMYLQAYRSMGAEMNAVLVAPASTRGWGQIGNSLILSTVSQIQRSLPVDPDRIYITGQSMGGHLSYRSALSLPDRFGAVSPHSGGYDFVEKQSIGNLLNVPGYAIWGVREPYGINVDNRTNREWAESHDMDWQFVEKNGGHEIYQDELAKVAAFFAERPRNMYPDQVYLRSGGHMKFVKTWQIQGWPEHTIYMDTRPLRWNMRHWLEVAPRPEHEGPLEILAENSGDNEFEITSNSVRGCTVFLHPEMVDFEKPVVIRANGDEVFNGRVEIDPALMFELAREFDDRGRVYAAKIEFQIETDGRVGLLDN